MACPVCSKPTAHDWRPFCSRRCCDLDLGKWLTEGYVLPVEDAEEGAERPGEAAFGSPVDPGAKPH